MFRAARFTSGWLHVDARLFIDSEDARLLADKGDIAVEEWMAQRGYVPAARQAYPYPDEYLQGMGL